MSACAHLCIPRGTCYLPQTQALADEKILAFVFAGIWSYHPRAEPAFGKGSEPFGGKLCYLCVSKIIFFLYILDVQPLWLVFLQTLNPYIGILALPITYFIDHYIKQEKFFWTWSEVPRLFVLQVSQLLLSKEEAVNLCRKISLVTWNSKYMQEK